MPDVIDIEARRQAVLDGMVNRIVAEEDEAARVAVERAAEDERLRHQRGLIRAEIARLYAARGDAVEASEESARALVANLRNMLNLSEQMQDAAVRLGKPGTMTSITGQGLRTEFAGYLSRLFIEAFGTRFGHIEWHSGTSVDAPWLEQESRRLDGGVNQLLKGDDDDKN